MGGGWGEYLDSVLVVRTSWAGKIGYNNLLCCSQLSVFVCVCVCWRHVNTLVHLRGLCLYFDLIVSHLNNQLTVTNSCGPCNDLAPE